jgi:hypothetical protein
MWNISGELKRWLLFFVIIANIVVSLADSAACSNHPIAGSMDSEGTQVHDMKLIHGYVPSGENDNNVSDKEESREYCVICFNALGLSVSYNENTALPALFRALESVRITLLEGYSSIYKPPKNR